MKITKQKLRQIIKEELESAAPLYTVNIERGEFSAPDLDAAIQTAKNWLEMGLQLQDGTSPEVLDALGVELPWDEHAYQQRQDDYAKEAGAWQGED